MVTSFSREADLRAAFPSHLSCRHPLGKVPLGLVHERFMNMYRAKIFTNLDPRELEEEMNRWFEGMNGKIDNVSSVALSGSTVLITYALVGRAGIAQYILNSRTDSQSK